MALRWGKIGTKGTTKAIKSDQCRKNNPALELKERILAKLNQGYQIIPHNTQLP